MDNRTPKVSVGLPVFNGEKYLANALSALTSQDFEDFEIVISDNASTDSTPDICREFIEKDRRIRYFRNPSNIGLAANHNRVFELSRGKLFKWAAYDDDFPRPMLARFVEVFEQCPPSVCVVYSQCEYINELGIVEGIDSDGVNLDHPSPWRRLAKLLSNIHMYNSPYGLMRSDILAKTRRLGLYFGSDHVLMAELAMLGEFVEIPDPLLRIRRHPGRTYTANRTNPDALRELFKPGQSRKFWKMGIDVRIRLELVRSAFLVAPTFADRLTCTAVAAVTPQWRTLRAFGGRLKHKVSGTLSQEARPGHTAK